jgi:hypothetical protein
MSGDRASDHNPSPGGDRVADDADTAEAAEADTEARPIRTPSRRSGGASGVLAAAMIGVGQVIEPEKTHVEIVQVDDSPLDEEDFGFTLDFSDVPVMEPGANDHDSKDDH